MVLTQHPDFEDQVTYTLKKKKKKLHYHPPLFFTEKSAFTHTGPCCSLKNNILLFIKKIKQMLPISFIGRSGSDMETYVPAPHLT